jgi:hypothetical protein
MKLPPDKFARRRTGWGKRAPGCRTVNTGPFSSLESKTTQFFAANTAGADLLRAFVTRWIVLRHATGAGMAVACDRLKSTTKISRSKDTPPTRTGTFACRQFALVLEQHRALEDPAASLLANLRQLSPSPSLFLWAAQPRKSGSMSPVPGPILSFIDRWCH